MFSQRILMIVVAVAALQVSVASAQTTPNQSIAVHGHWTIEVRNPDGSIAERREFDNELLPEGKAILGSLVRRVISVGSWFIYISTSASSSTVAEVMTIGEPAAAAVLARYTIPTSTTLKVSGDASNRVIFSGNIQAPANFSVGYVKTYCTVCQLPGKAGCAATVEDSTFSFTATTIPTVNVIAGQLIQVTVTYTFS